MSKIKQKSKKNKQGKYTRPALRKKESKLFFQNTNWTYFVIGLLLVGFVIRMINVGVLSLWVDEYQVASWITDRTIHGVGSTAAYNKLISYITLLICSIFGVSELTLRFQAVLFGALTIPTLFFLGKKLFNEYVGLLAAFLACFSLFLVFWSRVAYNYGIAGFAFSLLLLVFLYAFEPSKNAIKEENTFFSKYELDKRYLLLLPIALVFAIFSHALCIFFFFGFGVYCLLNFTINFFDTGRSTPKIFNKYFPFAILTILGAGVLFNPIFLDIVKPILALVFPENLLSSIIPNLDRLGELWATERYKTFNLYFDILKYDFSFLHYAGLAGFVGAFFINKKSGAFLISFFLTLFLLMSFVYRSPALPNYLIYIYPLFLLSIAAFFYFLVGFLPKKFFPSLSLSNWKFVLYLLPFIIAASSFRYAEVNDLLTVKSKTGYQVDFKLSQWAYTNWKDAVKHVRNNMKNGDVVMATIPSAVNYYMGWKNPGALHFRQRYLDSHQTRKYMDFTTDNPTNMDAKTINGLTKTIKEHNRGWLLADYYFENVMTSPQARQIVFNNMDYQFDAVSSGDVKVFSWDHATPKAYPGQNALIALGKNKTSIASQMMNFNLKEANMNKDLTIELASQGVDIANEAFLVVNNKVKHFLPVNSSNGIQKVQVKVNKQYIQLKGNTIQFGYNPEIVREKRKGFSIHSIVFR